MRMSSVVPRSKIVYMSMEIGLDAAIPTYSGGLGILAGDFLKAAADLHAPIAGVTLLHRKGYFRQHLSSLGQQTESPVVWDPSTLMQPLPLTVRVTIEGRTVHVRPWLYTIQGITGHTLSVYMLDTSLPENSVYDQTLTDHLYGGDERYRLCQETLLGLGGVAVMHALGRSSDLIYHMNEGHSALLTLALLERRARDGDLAHVTEADIESVRSHCVFTTHTPVPAGHDRFPMHLVRGVLGDVRTNLLERLGFSGTGELNMTSLALYFSRYINGVAMKHGEVSRDMFPTFPISAITNGVHATTWTAPPFQKLFDKHMAPWRHDNNYLRYASGMSCDQIRGAHAEAKRRLLANVEARTGVKLPVEVMTLGFARRAAEYKRAPLLLSDHARLRRIAREVGPLQILYAGKAHPRDDAGKEMIKGVFRAGSELGDDVRVLYLENYDMALALELVSGVDLWLNTPARPLEASGTSGMKAALNGVPSLSILDGWWIEGHYEGHTGWSIGNGSEDAGAELASLYDKLEHVILPLYYRDPDGYAKVMRSTIAINGPFFNTQRMLQQYLSNAYFPVETMSASTPALSPESVKSSV
jgi:starch phosphorylase